jgi:uncharacterized protein (TIGR02391 family)
MSIIDAFNDNQLEQICAVLADTSTGLTGSEIGNLLRNMKIIDPAPSMTKRRRLCEALQNKQRQDLCGNNVVAFIQRAMDPIRFTDRASAFESKRQELNQVLAFCGYILGEDGKVQRQTAVRTLMEAEEQAGRLRAELQRRGVHGDVMKFCRSELLQKNYFHAVFEATKSVADKIRSKTGLTADGADLVDQAFGSGKAGMPFVAFNTQQTETERSEHIGLMNLMKGMFGAFRNVTAHAPKITWSMTEQDALDLLTIASFLHRRLDAAVRTPRTS